MFVQSESEADTFIKEQGNKKGLMGTTGGPIVLISSLIIEDFSKSRAENQALTGCFCDFAWLKAVG